MMASKRVKLCRDDFSSSISKSVRNLVKDQNFTDVTLVSEHNEQIKAHKVILSSSSKFFEKILTMNPHQHPLIYLKGVKQELLHQIIEFIYIGEVKLCESEVDSFVKLGKELEVEGLADDQLEEVQGDIATEEPIVPKLEVEVNSSLEERLDEVEVGSFLEERLEEDMDSEFSFEELATAETAIETEIIAAPPKKRIKQERGADNRYSCPQCDYSSEHHVSVKKHRLSKHEAVRFQCERCERSYTDSSALLRHKKSFHDGVVHKCETCDKCFSEGGALTRHKKNIHSSIN